MNVSQFTVRRGTDAGQMKTLTYLGEFQELNGQTGLLMFEAPAGEGKKRWKNACAKHGVTPLTVSCLSFWEANEVGPLLPNILESH